MTHRVLVVKRPQDLPAGWTRKAPFPEEGLTDEHWQVVNVGEQLLGSRYDVILITQRAWAHVNKNEKARAWFDQSLSCRMDPGGIMVWLWEDES